MKKTILLPIFIFFVIATLTGCRNQYKDMGTDVLKEQEHGNVILQISIGNKTCVPVELVLYDDNKYELFTEYKSCKKNQECVDILIYEKSIKGTYDFDPIKIIEEENIEINKSHSMDNLPEFEIYVGDAYVQKGYEYYYSIKKGTTNKSLNEFLKSIKIDLKECAIPNYSK